MATGIMGFLDWSPEEKVRHELAFEQRRKQEALEDAKANRAAAWQAEIKERCHAIESILIPHLSKEIKADFAQLKERAERPTTQEDFAKFRECAESFGLPSLPAPPQAVALFLADGRNATSRIAKLAKSISTVHKAVGFSDPCDDILVRALLRQAREEETSKPEQQEGNNT
jgi:hypothetical protein